MRHRRWEELARRRGQAAGAFLFTLLALSGLKSAVTLELNIAIVEQEPELAVQLAAAVEAALAAELQADADGVEDEDVTITAHTHVAHVEPDEPLAVPGHICAQAAAGSSVAIGGGEGSVAALSAQAAARAGLPLMLLHTAPLNDSAAALELLPPPAVLAEACMTLCWEKGWTEAVLLHQGDARGAALLAPGALAEPLTLITRQLPPNGDDSLLRNLLLVLKKAGKMNFIVWCGAEQAVRVLDAAQRVGLLDQRHAYIVLALDLHTQMLSDYSYGGANITGLMLDSESINANMTLWREAYAARLGTELNEEEADRVAAAPPSALLLAYAAATRTARAMRYLQLPSIGPAADSGCERGAAAFHADTLLNYMRSEEPEGTMLQIRELIRGGELERVGMWSRGADGVSWSRVEAVPPERPPDSMTNRTFTVLIAMNDPYVMHRESDMRLSGNDRFEGFCIELIDELSKLLQFNYTFIEHKDGGYGNYNNTTRQWTGMMRRLMDDKDVDFAITDLTITAEREQAVDFTTPFMNLGIGILFRKPEAPEPKIFAFLLPFSQGVWLGLALAYAGSSLLLYVAGRLCPEEWQNPYPCVEEPESLENQFTLGNAFWFNLGAVLLQGSEIAPVAYGTRAVASAWWLFALVITSSYTANLATLLAKKSSTDLIHNVEDLANNDLNITYGAKAGGSTYTFFEHSRSPMYKKMYANMKDEKMPNKNEDGIEKVKKERYAFLMESTTIEYTIERDCSVNMVNATRPRRRCTLAPRRTLRSIALCAFSLSTSPAGGACEGYLDLLVNSAWWNSPYRQKLNLALLKLQESGKLREMKETWWKEKHGGGACKEGDDRESTELSMLNFLGLFYVLVVGSVLGVVVSLCDLMLGAWRRPRDPQQPYARRLAAELRFVFNFERSVKPLEGSLGESGSGSAHSDSSRMSAERVAGECSAEGSAGAECPAEISPQPSVRRRRSSMHAASVRLARHARQGDSATPARNAR